MTIITIKKRKFNVEEVAKQALALANSGTVKPGSSKLSIIENSDDPAGTERKIILAAAIYRTLKYTWGPRWERIDEDDLVGTILTANKNRVRGLRRGWGK